MFVEMLIAIVLPVILIWFFTRVTYNKFVAILLTIILLIVAFGAFDRSIWVQGAGVVGIIIGYIFSAKPSKKTAKKWK